MQTLIKGGYVLTMEDGLGDLPIGDILVQDGLIAEVADRIEAPDAEVIDASGRVVTPGFIDAHRHVWQSLLKGLMSDKSLPEYMVEARSMLCGCFDAEDAYIANYLGGLESLNSGVTTVVDHSHLQSSADVSRALVSGLIDSGVGGLFCYALQNVPTYLNGPPDSVDKVRDDLMSMPDQRHDETALEIKAILSRESAGRLAFGVALPEATPYLPLDYAKVLFDRAAALGPRLVTGHWSASYQNGEYVSLLRELIAKSSFNNPTLLTHCNLCNDDDLKLMAGAGIGLCTCPTIEMGMGLGPRLAFKYREYGGQAAIGVDIGSYFKTDILADTRLMLQAERSERASKAEGLAQRITPTARDALRILTSGGASAIGLASEIGSIAPGKRADIVISSLTGPGRWADTDPAGWLLFYTDTSTIETVLCNGIVRKSNGKLVGVDEEMLARRCEEAMKRITERYSKLSREMMKSAWQGMF